MIIDGVPFKDSIHQDLADLKNFASNLGMQVWFTIRTHRHEEPGPDGTPTQLMHVADLFDVVIQLVPVGKHIQIKAFKGPDADDQPDLMLDPATMLIQDQT
jgi:hypothetical protein